MTDALRATRSTNMWKDMFVHLKSKALIDDNYMYNVKVCVYIYLSITAHDMRSPISFCPVSVLVRSCPNHSY